MLGFDLYSPRLDSIAAVRLQFLTQEDFEAIERESFPFDRVTSPA